VDSWDVPVCLLYAHSFELVVFVFDTVFLECLVHIHRSTQPLPNVAASMSIKLQIAFQDLLDSLFAWHLQYKLMICEHVDQLYVTAFLCKSTNH
jgi:hypothetical protein